MANNKRRGGFGFSMNLTGPGSVFTLGIIALAIGMGLLLSRGVTPKSVLSDPGETGDIEVVLETPDPDQKGLQLKTIKFKECGNTVTINLLVDRSGSMDNPTPSRVKKIDRLKEAIRELLATAKDESIIGMQSFAADQPRIEVPISYYKDVKALMSAKVAALPSTGGTHTYAGLSLSLQMLREAIPIFPADRKFNFIFISDGEPNPPTQDPRLFNPNPVDEIKALGVTVYSLGIFDSGQSGQPELANLLRSVATSDDHYYAANNADDTKKLLTQITNRICNSLVTPTPTP